MSAFGIITAGAATMFRISADDLWLTPRSGAPSQVRGFAVVPGRDDLLNDAPMSLDNRLISLLSTASAGTGDLITAGGVTYSLARSPDPDSVGATKQWIGVPLELSVGSVTYHADGYPLVAWNGVEWVVSA